MNFMYAQPLVLLTINRHGRGDTTSRLRAKGSVSAEELHIFGD